MAINLLEDNLFYKNQRVLSFDKDDTVWYVCFVDMGDDFFGAFVQTGADEKSIPLILTELNVEHSIEKINRLPIERIETFSLFRMAVAGAISLSMKYGK